MEHHMAETGALTLTRHLEMLETGGPTAGSQTLGIGILADENLGTAYAFVLAEGLVDFPPILRQHVESRFGRFDFAQGKVVEPEAPRT